MRVLLGMVALALIAAPASAGLVNGSFEDGLNGWTTSNVMLNADQYNPSPITLDGENKAGDSNCNARNSLGSQEGYCDVNPAWECFLVGGLAGGDNGGYTYFLRVQGGGSLELSGVNNWVMAEIPIGPCVGQPVIVEFGSTGDGTWGAAGYHVDALDLVCVPEPTGLALLGLAGLPLLLRRRR